MQKSDPPPLITGVLLAAGFSRRFGASDKLLQPLPNGMPIAIQAARTLIEALPCSVAVVREENISLQASLESLDYIVVTCPPSASDMSDSLKLGLAKARSAFPNATGLLIALADMPHIQPGTIRQVAAQLTEAWIVQPTFQGKRGNPVGFSVGLMDELLAITGDQGAREVLRAHQEKVLLWPCEDAGILQDIDTPADLG